MLREGVIPLTTYVTDIEADWLRDKAKEEKRSVANLIAWYIAKSIQSELKKDQTQ